MKKFIKKNKLLIIILILITILLSVVSIYRYIKIKPFDKAAYTELYKNLEVDGENFVKQSDLQRYITGWADQHQLKYQVDSNKNIIFVQDASSKKSNVSPTVIIVNYNYENAVDNRKVLASAAMLAKIKLENSGKKIVIFVNNEKNDGSNYYGLDKKYFTNNSKVVYLDYGKSSYISTNSFNSINQTFKLPSKHVESKCDTAIKIHIKGLISDCIDTGINKKANPISLLSTILTRLKSKSTICELASIKVNNKGNMYPNELEATIMMNSYSVDGFTAYLDKRIKAFDKACKDDNPDCEYSYKVIKKKNKLPSTVYSKETFNSLTTLLFTITNGSERLTEDNIIPDGYEVKDIYGIICPNQLRVENGIIYLDVYSQGINSKYLNQIIEDNKISADLANAELVNSITYPQFQNNNSNLIKTLQRTYVKVSDLGGTEIYLPRDYDTYFTPMTYLNEINNNMDIVHVKENSRSAAIITNMLICYIQTKGNFLSL